MVCKLKSEVIEEYDCYYRWKQKFNNVIMSKAARKGADAYKKFGGAARVAISSQNFFKTRIAAQCASAAPPLGPLLGSFGLNISNFCKDFNEKTKNYRKGIPLPIIVRIKSDRSYDIQIQTPPISFYLMQAAGIEAGKLAGEEKAGEITLKHIYEIAAIKHADPYGIYQIQELKEVVRKVVGLTKPIGLDIVKEIDPDKYKLFLEERKVFIEKLMKEREEEQKLKLQRV